MPARGPSPASDARAQQPLGQVAAVLLVGALVATVAVTVLQPDARASEIEARTFGSRDELAAFLERHEAGRTYGGEAVAADGAVPMAAAPAGASAGAAGGASEHSTTNVQVAGVDEADIVKNDGTYIYAVSDGRVLIVRAYPPSQARVVAEVPLGGATPTGLYLSGDRLVVLGAADRSDEEGEFTVDSPVVLPHPRRGSTTVRVFDVSDRAAPSLERNVTVDGRLKDSRMIDGHVYAVLQAPATLNESGEPVVPTLHPDQEGFPEISYFNESHRSYRYVNVLSVPVGDGEVRNEAYLLGRATELYASTSNLYLATPQRVEDELSGLRIGAARTRIHRIHLEEGRIELKASGEVPGRILNQFSMDEHEGHLRVATTVGHVSRGFDDGVPSSTNNVYVLDGQMRTVGRLEGIAPGERIYSARFMGDRAYLVTFKKVDPFFVLDLSDPTDPTVLGELKLPGYSDYLHPLGDDHVIGIGKDTVAAESGDFAWYQGVKIAVFDASDVQNPKVLDDMVIGDRGSESAVLRDHKAFLLDRERGFMAMPVTVAEVDESDYDGDPPPNAHGEPVWQGAYVIDVSTEDGLSVRGRVTHMEAGLDGEREGEHRRLWSKRVRRTLTMDDVLYTVSESTIKANALGDLAELARVELAAS